MRTLLALVILVAMLPGQVNAAPAGQSCTPLTEGAGITITGPNGQNTPPFNLAAGTYRVTYSFSVGKAAFGNAIVTVKRADGAFYPGATSLTNVVLSQQQPSLSGESYLYGVQRGAHYLEVMSAGEWSVTLTPVS